MSEYTPTTVDVRDVWGYWRRDPGVLLDDVAFAEFDRWLAAEKAKWQAEALDLVRADLRADAMIRSYDKSPMFTPGEVFDLAARYTPEWVDQTIADRIEKGSDDGR